MCPIGANLQAVRARIDRAARAAGRSPQSVQLLAVQQDLSRRGGARSGAGRPARIRRELRAGSAGKDGRAGGSLSWSGTSSGRSRATRRRASPIASIGCMRSIARRSPDGSPEQRPARPGAPESLHPGQRLGRGEQERRRAGTGFSLRAKSAAAPAPARPDGDSGAHAGRSSRAAPVRAAARAEGRPETASDSPSIRCRWACRPTWRRPSPKARRWCASAPRFSANGKVRERSSPYKRR